MIPPSFEYLRPKTIPEAIAMLQQHGDAAKILSGGQSLIPMMKLRLARPSVLIDINRISGLSHVKEEDGYLKIGGLTREAELEASPLVRSKYAILADTTHVIADPQVRNLATVGGNLAHGDPPARSAGAYLKLERKVGDFATAAVAVQMTFDEQGACQKAGIGLTNVGATPVKAQKAEQFLLGKKLDDDAISQAAQLAADEAEPSADLRGPVEYKKGLVKELAKRALQLTRERVRK
jgi:carbon-monoxide dehydrogenase medium subunit